MHDVPFFDRFARLYDAFMPAADPEPVRRALDRTEGSCETIVDVGGGSGRVASVLGGDPIVVDAARGMLLRAREKGAPVVQGDAGRLPIRAGSADAVVIVDALHHFPTAEATLSEARRVIRPGGVLVIRDFDPQTLRGMAIDFSERLVRFGSTFYSPADLRDLVTAAGFTTEIQDRGFTYTVVGMADDVEPTEARGSQPDE